MGKIVVAKIVAIRRQSPFYRHGIIGKKKKNVIAWERNNLTRGNDKNVTLCKIDTKEMIFLTLSNKTENVNRHFAQNIRNA